MEGESKEELTRIAKKNKDSTTLMLLKLEKGTETLATHNDLHPHVDRLFQATVADFSEDQPPKFTELSVHKLMHKDQDFFDLTDESKFKWFHLPANNVSCIALYNGLIASNQFTFLTDCSLIDEVG